VDTLTHAFSGALIARAAWRRQAPATLRAMTLAAGLAAAFPDLDYLLFWLAPRDFLHLHRGATHSLVMLPLWALALAAILGPPLRQHWQSLYLPCAAGLAIHIAGDLVTLYGTQLWWPISTTPVALGLSFDFNPWVAAIVLPAALAAWSRPLPALGWATAGLAALMSLQAALRVEALAVARASGPGAPLRALPQPLSPFHWLLVVGEEDGHRIAHLDLLEWRPPVWLGEGWPLRLAAGYRPAADLRWTRYRRPDAPGESGAETRAAWARLEGFARFAELPALYRIDRDGRGVCVWFADLRHILPALEPSFRYGACRAEPGDPWRPYRLRYFSRDDRQPL
jgi:inner membrane protein